MTTTQKSTIAGGIVALLNESLKKSNKELCNQNLHYKQKPLHGFETILKLTMMGSKELNKIAKAAGL